jgi:hypothetical protein
MPALGQRDPEKEQFWRDNVERWRASGISKSGFCESEGLKLNSFCNWERILRQRDVERRVAEKRAKRAARRTDNGSPELFVPLNIGGDNRQGCASPPPEIARSSQIDILVPSNGLIVRVGNDFDTALLHEVLNALRGWTC